MKYETRIKIYNDKNLLRFLRENSYYIKYFNRRGNFDDYVKQMKKRYSLSFSDKVERMQFSANIIKAFFETSKEN